MLSYRSIIRADYLQRTRSYTFLITLLAGVCLAYTFVPADGAKYATVRVGNYAGFNNAAWIGHTTAIMASTFLWLIGFYLVNNGIKRDRDTGVGQIIATTSISNFKYLLAKALSNFFVLLTITVIVMLMALVLVFARGSRYPFDAVQFFMPYIFATIPTIFCVSVLAVIAEVLMGKYSTLQNIGFFVLFGLVAGANANGSSDGLYWMDVLGVRKLTGEIANIVNTQYSQDVQQVSVGFVFSSKISIEHFLFTGIHLPAAYFISRLLWMTAFVLLLKISAQFFHRFDVKEITLVKKKKTVTGQVKEKLSLQEIHIPALPVAATNFTILPLVKTELLMLVRKGRRWFWLINLGCFIALCFMPLDIAHKFGIPIIWFLQVNRWADIASKEKYFRTHYFTYAAYKPLQRLFTAQMLAGFLLAVALVLPVIVRYALLGNIIAASAIITGALFVIAFSVCSGILTGGSRFFEIVFFMLTYVNMNLVPPADYFGAFKHGISYMLMLPAVIACMLVVSFMFRKYEIAHQ
jgi:hypothetical protein